MVQPGEHAGHRVPVLSGASAADAAGTQDDHRRRRRHPRRNACAFCGTRPGMWCSIPTRCTAAAAGSELFGRSSTRYPSYYRPNPASRNFVQHLRLWYAQSHPDEDFAETFAVWLTPRSNWRKRYEGWPALKKLQYVDELMAEIARPEAGADDGGSRSIRCASSASRSASTTRRSSSTIPSTRRGPTTAICCASSPTIRGTVIRRRPRPSSGTTAPASGGWCRNGPASISLRSTRCSMR